MTDCNICKRSDPSIVETPGVGVDGRSIECPLCGKYQITGTAEACIHEQNVKLAAWVRDQNEHGQTLTISSYTLEEINKLSVTGQRAGVYFEAGYAIGLNRPVIWCVRKDQLDDVHFDTRQYNHIVWETPEELKEKLYQLIRAVIGTRNTQ